MSADNGDEQEPAQQILTLEQAAAEKQDRQAEEHRRLGTRQTGQAEHQSRVRKPASSVAFMEEQIDAGEDEKYKKRGFHPEYGIPGLNNGGRHQPGRDARRHAVRTHTPREAVDDPERAASGE